MNETFTVLLVLAESSGWFAPFAFILLHLLRSFLFVPVAVICLAGGVLFGSLFGTIYSLIGLMFVSMMFYLCIDRMPKTYHKLMVLKQKWFGPYRQLTVGQIAILRLLPFIHYHLLSFCLMERNKKFKDYLISSFYVNLPLAIFYTVFGQFISRFTPTMIIIILISLSCLFYILREKIVIIKWTEFFKQA